MMMKMKTKNNDATDEGPTDTEAPSDNDDEPQLPGVQDAIPGVPDTHPGVQAATPGVEQHYTQEHEDEDEEEIVFGTDSETDSDYEPSINPTSDDDANADEEHETDDEDKERRTQTTTRSGRRIRIDRHLFDNYQFVGTAIPPDAYTPSVQTAFGNNAKENHSRWHINDEIIEYAFTQYSLKQGLQKFPVEGPKATMAEMRQLHEKHTFQPEHAYNMTEKQKRDALGSLIFIKEKRCGKVKARACADSRQQRLLYDKHESSSPTVKTELRDPVGNTGRR
jgi:glucan-binding YG repeat protein